MKKIFFRPHLGLGDHIICNGMLRHFAEEDCLIKMPCKKHNLVSVSYMFSDLPNVDIIPVDDDKHANYWTKFFVDKGYSTIMLGSYGKDFDIDQPQKTFDQAFYRQAGIDHAIKWEKFKIPRRIEVEKQFFNDFYGFNSEFVFVHEDKDRNYLIRKELLSSSSVVRPNKDYSGNIFNYCWILENAIQIDCLDSSFSNLADLLSLKAKIKRIHIYGRPDTVLPLYKQNWEFIK